MMSKKKKEKTGGQSKNSTDMDICQQGCRQTLIPTKGVGGGGGGGHSNVSNDNMEKGRRIGTVTTVAGGDRAEGGIN